MFPNVKFIFPDVKYIYILQLRETVKMKEIQNFNFSYKT